MPEMQFVVRWPDDTLVACYSPSLVICDYFEVGKSYALADFVDRSRTALTIASERVEAKFGFPCVRARAQLAQIVDTAGRFAVDGLLTVTVEAFHPPGVAGSS